MHDVSAEAPPPIFIQHLFIKLRTAKRYFIDNKRPFIEAFQDSV